MELPEPDYRTLVGLVRQIREAQYSAEDPSEFVRAFVQIIPEGDVEDFARGDLMDDEVVDYFLGLKNAERHCSREELIRVIEEIRKPQGNEVEDMLLVHTFAYNCQHPAGTDLIFYPAEHFGEGASPSSQQIADMALGLNGQ